MIYTIDLANAIANYLETRDEHDNEVWELENLTAESKGGKLTVQATLYNLDSGYRSFIRQESTLKEGEVGKKRADRIAGIYEIHEYFLEGAQDEQED